MFQVHIVLWTLNNLEPNSFGTESGFLNDFTAQQQCEFCQQSDRRPLSSHIYILSIPCSTLVSDSEALIIWLLKIVVNINVFARARPFAPFIRKLSNSEYCSGLRDLEALLKVWVLQASVVQIGRENTWLPAPSLAVLRMWWWKYWLYENSGEVDAAGWGQCQPVFWKFLCQK